MLFIEDPAGAVHGPAGDTGHELPGIYPTLADVPLCASRKELPLCMFIQVKANLGEDRVGTYRVDGMPGVWGTYDNEYVLVHTSTEDGATGVTAALYGGMVTMFYGIMRKELYPLPVELPLGLMKSGQPQGGAAEALRGNGV